MTRHAEIASHLRYFSELGVFGLSRDAAWRTRTTPAAVSAPGAPAAGAAAPLETDVPAETTASAPPPDAAGALVALREEIGDCTRCVLHRLGRRQVVFGTGNPDARLMFVGEAPGAD